MGTELKYDYPDLRARLKLAEYRVRCIEAIFSGGSTSQRDKIEESAQKLYDFVIKGLLDEEKKG